MLVILRYQLRLLRGFDHIRQAGMASHARCGAVATAVLSLLQLATTARPMTTTAAMAPTTTTAVGLPTAPCGDSNLNSKKMPVRGLVFGEELIENKRQCAQALAAVGDDEKMKQSCCCGPQAGKCLLFTREDTLSCAFKESAEANKCKMDKGNPDCTACEEQCKRAKTGRHSVARSGVAG